MQSYCRLQCSPSRPILSDGRAGYVNKLVDVTDTTVVYTPQIHYRHDLHDGRVCYGHDRRKMATHTNQTTTTNQP